MQADVYPGRAHPAGRRTALGGKHLVGWSPNDTTTPKSFLPKSVGFWRRLTVYITGRSSIVLWPGLATTPEDGTVQDGTKPQNQYLEKSGRVVYEPAPRAITSWV
jgi:hypothetical protein